MNAIDFIQKHGVKRAKECLPAYEKHYCGLEQLFVEDLKRLVESVERINFIGGIAEAKTWVEKTKFGLERGHYPSYSTSAIKEKIKRNEQAIADYEAIYSNDIKIEVSFGISLMPSERLACIDLTPRPVIDCETLDYPEDYTSPNCKKFDERVK